MNILIVDDQPNVISSLLQRVPWQGIGISNVYTANSALAARDVLFSKQVDILLADIEMPQENGLSLVRWIRSKGLEIECILLTSHANFYYAQIAISLEICDYVIQPAPQRTLCAPLKKLRIRFFKSDRSIKKFIFKDFSPLHKTACCATFLRPFQ